MRSGTFAVLVIAVGFVCASVSTASAATVEVLDGTVVFSAAPGEVNDVRAGGLSGAGPNLTIIDSGAALTAGAGCEQIDTHTARCVEADEDPARPLTVWAGDGDDRVIFDDFRSRTVAIHGAGGNDRLHGGSSDGGPTEVLGEAGNDTLSTALNYGGGGVLRGADGDDVLTVHEASSDRVFGGAGNDQLNVRGCDSSGALDGGVGNDSYTFRSTDDLCGPLFVSGIVPGSGFDTLDQSGADPWEPLTFNAADCPACVEAIVGTPFGDQISGDDNAQAIRAGDGDDVLDGGGGVDFLSGQGGNDTINSRDGRTDVVSCGGGNDSVTADPRDKVAKDCENLQRLKSRV